MDATQTQLLWAVRDAQNRTAWHAFHRIYAPLVTNFVRRMGLSESDADDVTQEVLMSAHKSLVERVYDAAKGPFRTWLFGIARRRALAAFRARRRRSRVQIAARQSGVDLLDQLEDKSEESTRRIWDQEWRYALLEEAMRVVRAQTGETAFRAFHRCSVDRHRPEEVAGELGISVATVYVYKSRVLRALRMWIQNYEDD